MHSVEFVLGLKDPLLGPTGVEAVAYGAILVNPTYTQQEVRQDRGRGHDSQHGYLKDYVGDPRVCTVDYAQVQDLVGCITRDGLADGVLPDDFTKAAYEDRVRALFRDVVGGAVLRQKRGV